MAVTHSLTPPEARYDDIWSFASKAPRPTEKHSRRCLLEMLAKPTTTERLQNDLIRSF